MPQPDSDVVALSLAAQEASALVAAAVRSCSNRKNNHGRHFRGRRTRSRVYTSLQHDIHDGRLRNASQERRRSGNDGMVNS